MGFVVIQWDLIVIYGDSMGFNGDLWWFNGIYPLVIEHRKSPLPLYGDFTGKLLL